MAAILLQATGRPGLSSLVPYALAGPAAAVLAGLLFPSLAQAFRPFVGPALLVMLAAMLLRIDRAHLVAHVRRPRLALIIMAWLIVGVPFLVAGMAQLAGLPGGLARCLVLGLQALGALVFMGLGLRRALTISLLTGNRTVALVFAALGTGADPVVASFLSWSFLVMYTLPVVAPHIYGWIVRVAQPCGDGALGGDGLHPVDRALPAGVPAREDGPVGAAGGPTNSGGCTPGSRTSNSSSGGSDAGPSPSGVPSRSADRWPSWRWPRCCGRGPSRGRVQPGPLRPLARRSARDRPPKGGQRPSGRMTARGPSPTAGSAHPKVHGRVKQWSGRWRE